MKIDPFFHERDDEFYREVRWWGSFIALNTSKILSNGEQEECIQVVEQGPGQGRVYIYPRVYPTPTLGYTLLLPYSRIYPRGRFRCRGKGRYIPRIQPEARSSLSSENPLIC